MSSTSKTLKVDDWVSTDSSQISWTVNLKKDIARGVTHSYQGNTLTTGVYRPFNKQKLYFDKPFIERPGISQKLFPTPNHENLLIAVTGPGSSKPFTALMTDQITGLDTIEKAQCLPLYYYEKAERNAPSLFDGDSKDEYVRHDGISDFIVKQTHARYHNSDITKEDIFYYVYGVLHSPEYQREFANDLKKTLPRLPLVEQADDFWAFSKAGRELAKLHIGYENIAPYEGARVSGTQHNNYHVDKLRFASKNDKTKILYNAQITIENIPGQAYEYIVNGKSAIEWILDRYQVKTDKASGIVNDPNDWAKETGNPRYILDLLLSVINVSVQTVDIVNNLPKIEFGK